MKTASLILMASLLIGSAAFADPTTTSNQNQAMKTPITAGNSFIMHPIPPARLP